MPDVTNEIEYITMNYYGTKKEEHILTLTQEYYQDFNFGHWKYVVVDKKGNILETNKSLNAPPIDKVNMILAKQLYNRFYEFWEKNEKRIESSGFTRC